MINKVRENMIKDNLDGLWITDPTSLKFVFNIDINPGERFLGVFVGSQTNTLVLNKLFPEQEFDGKVEVIYDHHDVNEVISKITTGKRIGLDKYMVAQFVLPLIESRPDVEFVNGSDTVDQLRAIKSSQEIELMKKASELNDKVMEIISSEIKVSMTEIEIRDRIEELFAEFNTVPSFNTIVAFGDHGVDPHAVVSERKLKAGESIIIDMGCVVEGYCSDMTRTFFVKDNPIPEIYDLVLKANVEAIKAIKPGVRFSDLDKVARDIIEEGGYGEYFIHRLGHGIGQEVHEPYDVSSSNHQLVLPGMCFSIEPGIYKPGVDAVRIEDLVYVDNDGYGQVLNHVDKTQPILFSKERV